MLPVYSQEMHDPQYGRVLKDLEVLRAFDRVVPRTRQRKLFVTDEDSEHGADNVTLPPPPSQGT